MKRILLLLCSILVIGYFLINHESSDIQVPENAVLTNNESAPEKSSNLQAVSKKNRPAEVQSRKGLSVILDTLSSSIQNLKSGNKELHCVSKIVFALSISNINLQNISQQESDKFYAITGQQWIGADGKPEEIEPEELARLDNYRLNYLLSEYENNESDYINRKLLNFCLNNREKGICNQEQFVKIKSNISNDLQNWLLLMNEFNSEEVDKYQHYLANAANAPLNNNYRNKYLSETYRYLHSYYRDIPGYALIAAIGYEAATSLPQYSHVFKACKIEANHHYCLAIAERLIQDENTILEASMGFGLLRQYYEMNGDNQMAENIKKEKEKKLSDNMHEYFIEYPVFDEAYYDYVLSTLDNRNESEFLSSIVTEAKRVIETNPDQCTF